MKLLNPDEQATVEWFRQIEKESAAAGARTRVDAVGLFAAASVNEEEPSAPTVKWMDYVASIAASKGATVTMNSEGCLVMVLPRHLPAKQTALPL